MGPLAAAEEPIALVEDDRDARLALSETLSSMQCLVDTFDCAHAVLERFLTNRPYAVLVCDVNLPDMSGFELVEQLRERRPAFMPAVIFVTGQHSAEIARHALALEAVDFLFKPFDLIQLRAAISRSFDLFERRQRHYESQRTVSQMFLRLRDDLDTLRQQVGLESAEHVGEVSAEQSIPVELLLHVVESLQLRGEIFPGAFQCPEWEIFLRVAADDLRGLPIHLAAAYDRTSASVTTAQNKVRRLESRGLIRRQVDALDRRRSFLFLSEKGRRALERFAIALVSSSANSIPKGVSALNSRSIDQVDFRSVRADRRQQDSKVQRLLSN